MYDENVWRVYAFLAYRVRRRELVEDLTQTTFERALRAWPRFDPRRASEATWLLTIARNLLIDHSRRDRADPHAEIDEALLQPVASPEEEIAAGSPELAAALEQLSDRERELIALRFGADLSGPEIAEAVGLSLANVQQILSRSLRRLRAALSEA